VTPEGVIDIDLDVRDTYINLRVNADRLTLPARSAHPSKVQCLFVLLVLPNFVTVIGGA